VCSVGLKCYSVGYVEELQRLWIQWQCGINWNSFREASHAISEIVDGVSRGILC